MLKTSKTRHKRVFIKIRELTVEQIETQISQHINGLPESLINYFKNDYEAHQGHTIVLAVMLFVKKGNIFLPFSTAQVS